MNLTLFKTESFIASIHFPMEKNQVQFFDELGLRETITHFPAACCPYFLAYRNGDG